MAALGAEEAKLMARSRYLANSVADELPLTKFKRWNSTTLLLFNHSQLCNYLFFLTSLLALDLPV
jgi:hypothetical protein